MASTVTFLNLFGSSFLGASAAGPSKEEKPPADSLATQSVELIEKAPSVTSNGASILISFEKRSVQIVYRIGKEERGRTSAGSSDRKEGAFRGEVR